MRCQPLGRALCFSELKWTCHFIAQRVPTAQKGLNGCLISKVSRTNELKLARTTLLRLIV
ncbi:Uncharacterised protein [Vibrio cholerae]|nr:Uncharacterised protein [Vibrio cholerae]CSE07431.1 Uncharacterised protein [Vibrio cholerae]